MQHSEQIDQLATALAFAQRDIRGAAKNAANPYFKSSYADLASVWEAVREPLTANGLSIVQAPAVDNGLAGVTTLLLHSSGQWIRFTSNAEVKDLSAQSVGSAVTYLRRYALSSATGTYNDVLDDDGEAAQGRKPAAPKAPEGYSKWLEEATAIAGAGGVSALQDAFKRAPKDIRAYLTQQDAEKWASIKAIASEFDQTHASL